MSLVLDVLAWAALLAGGFFAIVSGVGLLRMPDLFTRMHAASVNDTLGVGLLTLGMLLQTGDWAVGVRLAIILVLLWVTGAVTVHALARAALHDGEAPLLAGADGRLRATGVAEVDPELALRLSRSLISERVEDGPAAAPETSGARADRAGGEDPTWNS